MSLDRVQIIVSESGSRVVKRNLGGIGTTSKASAAGVQLLQRALVVLGGAAVLGQTVRTLASFEQALSTVKAVAQATEAEFAKLRATVQELGATTRFTATQAAEGLVFLARAGFTAQEQLEAIGDTLYLAQAGALDLGRAAEITVVALRGFRLETKEAARVTDVLATAANSATTDVSQLSDALKFVGPVASGVKVSFEETVAALSALSDAGLQGAMAGTGLRRVLSELESPSRKTAKLLHSMGLSASDVRVSAVGLTEALKKLAAAGIDTGMALEIFGDRGGPAFEVLVSSIPKVVEFTEKFNNAGGTARRVAAIMDDNLNGSLLRLKSAWEAVQLSFGQNRGTSILMTTIDGLASALRYLASHIELLDGIFIALAITSIPILISAVSALVAMVGGPAVIAVAALIGALSAYRNEIRLSKDSTATFGDFLTAASERIKLSLATIATVIQEQFGKISPAFSDFEFSMEGMIRFVARALDGFVGLFRGAIVAATSLWGNLGPALLDLTIQMMNGIIGVIETAIDGIIALFKTMADIIGNIIKAFTQSLGSLAQATQAALSGHVEIAGHIADNAGKVFNTRMQIAMTDLPGQLGRNFEDASESDLLPRIDNVAKGAATRLRDGVVDGFVEGFNEITVFSDSVNSMFDRADEIARNRTANLADGMGSPAAAVVGGAPTPTPTPQGAQPINQFEEGITDGMGRIGKEVNDTASLISDSLVGAFNNAEDALVGFVKTGKLDFSSLVDGMITDLARLAVRMAESAALNAIFPGSGDIASAFDGARATGGPVEPGKSYLVGENGPETFSPGMAGTVSPISQAPAEQAPANITIINVDSEAKIATFLRSTEGQRIILNANGGKSER